MAGLVNHLGHRLASLTLPQMRKVIEEGGSVMYQGKVITEVNDLPGPVELANGAPEIKDAAKRDLRSQMADLQRQLAALDEVPDPEPAADLAPATEQTIVRHFTNDGEMTEGELVAARAQLAQAAQNSPAGASAAA